MSAPARRGFTIIELMISLVITGIVLGAAYRLLTANQRFYRSQSVISDIENNIHEAALILSSEVREVSAGGGDIQQMTDTAITINAMRALGFVCGAPDLVLGRVVVNTASLYKYRNIDPTRDSVFIFREGLVTKNSDDRWLRGKVSATTTQNCANGATGTRLAMTSLLGIGNFTQLDSVTVGAPVRAFETVNYRLYDDGTGVWWLGVRNWISGAWTATSPIAGPLRPNNGLNMVYRDSTGAVTATAANVRSVVFTLRGISTQPINIAGRAAGQYADSLVITAALRN